LLSPRSARWLRSPRSPPSLVSVGSLGLVLATVLAGLGVASLDSSTARASPGAAPTLGSGPPGGGCPANLAGELRSTGSAEQLITVNTSSYGTSYGLLTIWLKHGACWDRIAGPYPARVGVNGLSDHKVEGDGTTPSGSYGIGPVVYGNSPNPGVHYPYHSLVCGDWWDEDPTSRWYNEFVHIPCGSYPAWTAGDSEALWTDTTAYQSFAFIEYNADPVVPYRGSAIFLHDGIAAPTTGCVSLDPTQLDQVLDWLLPNDDPRIVIGTDAEIRGY
jgi:L,D-peptidoglycan transpeptidase YkuD (ErfK/YbiS/YcfS/YnhG family)